MFILEALAILLTGFILFRISGKKTVAEMTGLEIITLLSMASTVGHAVTSQGLWKTILTMVVFVTVLFIVQFLAMKYNSVEKLFMGQAILVIHEGQIITKNLMKLRLSVDQLEARMREKGIASFSDVKTATVEMNGLVAFELMRHAKPVTIGELEKILAKLGLMVAPPEQEDSGNIFEEVVNDRHQKLISTKLK